MPDRLIPDIASLVAGRMDWPLMSLGVGLALCFLLLAPPIGRRYRVGRPDLPVREPGRHYRFNALVQVMLQLCHCLGQAISPFVPASYRRRLIRHLSLAGLNRNISAVEFTAAQLLIGSIVLTLSLLGSRSGYLSPLVVFILILTSLWWPWSLVLDAARRRRARIERDLPVFLDLITLAVRGGSATAAAISLAVDRGPSGPLGAELANVLREVRAGRLRQEAMREMADRLDMNGLTHAVGAMIAAERQGADLAQVLGAQAVQRRHERFLAAEQQAMKAPVKMLLPLVLFIFPGTFLVLMFPVALQLMDAGFL